MIWYQMTQWEMKMTLQLEVGKTYRARNGDVVRIVGDDQEDYANFKGDDFCYYQPSGAIAGDSDHMREFDLIEEISPVSPTSTLDAAIAKYEAAWAAAQEALDAAKCAADAIVRAAKEGKL
jgi:hypothetical protein